MWIGYLNLSGWISLDCEVSGWNPAKMGGTFEVLQPLQILQLWPTSGTVHDSYYCCCLFLFGKARSGPKLAARSGPKPAGELCLCAVKIDRTYEPCFDSLPDWQSGQTDTPAEKKQAQQKTSANTSNPHRTTILKRITTVHNHTCKTEAKKPGCYMTHCASTCTLKHHRRISNKVTIKLSKMKSQGLGKPLLPVDWDVQFVREKKPCTHEQTSTTKHLTSRFCCKRSQLKSKASTSISSCVAQRNKQKMQSNATAQTTGKN